jgi:hypothetical protein
MFFMSRKEDRLGDNARIDFWVILQTLLDFGSHSKLLLVRVKDGGSKT